MKSPLTSDQDDSWDWDFNVDPLHSTGDLRGGGGSIPNSTSHFFWYHLLCDDFHDLVSFASCCSEKLGLHGITVSRMQKNERCISKLRLPRQVHLSFSY